MKIKKPRSVESMILAIEQWQVENKSQWLWVFGPTPAVPDVGVCTKRYDAKKYKTFHARTLRAALAKACKELNI